MAIRQSQQGQKGNGLRSPKESFLTSGHAATFQKIVGSEAFEPACQHALLQLQYEMPPTTVIGSVTDPYYAIDANSQMYGARRVLDILLSLSEPMKPQTQQKRESLHYDAH